MFGLIKDLSGMLNQLSLNTLTFQLVDHYPEVLYELTSWIKKSKKRTNQHQKHRYKMFLWCHVRHINPLKENPERIKKKKDSKIVEKIDYDRTEFSVQEEDFSKI